MGQRGLSAAKHLCSAAVPDGNKAKCPYQRPKYGLVEQLLNSDETYLTPESMGDY
jgi:hypothetical protein